jgi:hypothetical protein
MIGVNDFSQRRFAQSLPYRFAQALLGHVGKRRFIDSVGQCPRDC